MKIQIINDGPEIPQPKLKHLKRLLDKAWRNDHYTCDGMHIGLLNTQKRLRLLYNPPVKLSLASNKKGTCVSFVIPIIIKNIEKSDFD